MAITEADIKELVKKYDPDKRLYIIVPENLADNYSDFQKEVMFTHGPENLVVLSKSHKEKEKSA